MSGTGPKAGGPLYVRRMTKAPDAPPPSAAELPGPVGERNVYRTMPRGDLLLAPATREGLRSMLEAVAGTGNRAVIDTSVIGAQAAAELAPGARQCVDVRSETLLEGVLVESDADRVAAIARLVSELPGRIVPVQDAVTINRGMLVHEVSISVNTAAAGGNASLLALAEE
jgi:RHH-type proline utilization regulon transcriptional repressor/proline dehydrogenase/delta 1-pyrroline-5-carboxylate dehydrogenase